MNRTLSIPEWRQLAREGTALPMRIPLMGVSMYPLVRYNRDHVTIMPADGDLGAGDIVLFLEHKRELYVVHRAWEIRDGRVLTWGDNCDKPDGWIPIEEILGKAVLIERGKRSIRPDRKKGIRWAKFWHVAGKAYRFYRKHRDRPAAKNKKQQT